MKVSDIMIRYPVVAEADEKLSTVLDKMEKYKLHQLPLVDGKNLLGLVILKNLLTSTHDPHKTEVKKFKVNTVPLDFNDTLEDAMYKIMESGFKALPVVQNNSLQGMLGASDLIKYVDYPEDISYNKLLDKVIVVRDDDNLGKALSLMSENNISRLPVVTYENRLIGCFDAFGAIKFIRNTMESVRPSDLTAVEKSSLKDFKTKDFMREAYVIETDEFSIKKIVNALQSHDEVIITNKGVPIGIVTPKDLLELAVRDEKLPLQVSRFEKIDPMMYARFESELNNLLKRFSKMFDIQNFYIYVNAHKTDGKSKYSLRARLITSKKVFPAHSHAWDLMDATHMLLDKLEKQLVKNHEKRIKSKRGRAFSKHDDLE